MTLPFDDKWALSRGDDRTVRELSIRSRDGDGTAFARFADVCRPILRAHLRKRLPGSCGRLLREDATQEVLARLAKYKPVFDHEGALRKWLWKTLRSVLACEIGRSHRRSTCSRSSEELERLPDVIDGPQLDENEQLALCMTRLPSDHQFVLHLHYWLGMPSARIAEILGTSKSAINTRLFRARKRLKALIEEDMKCEESLAA